MDREFDNVIKGLESMEIPMPKDLDESIIKTLEGLPKKRNLAKGMGRIAAGFILLIFSLSLLIYSNESFASMAMEIPGLNVLANFILWDDGIENAAANGYPYIENIVIREEGYEVVLTNIMVDETRITFNVKGTYVHPDTLVKRALEPMTMLFSLKDTTYSGAYDFNNDGSQTVNLFVHEQGEEKYIRNLIENQEPIVLICELSDDEKMHMTKEELEELYKEENEEPVEWSEEDALYCGSFGADEKNIRKVIHTIENIEIPVSEATVLFTKYDPVSEILEFPEGSIELDQLQVSPTKMELKGVAIPDGEKGISGIGFLDYSLTATNGIQSSVPTISKFGGSIGDFWLESIPSIYFAQVKEVVFSYEGYYYQMEHEAYEIRLDDKYPKTLDYYGYEINIQWVIYKNGELRIGYTIPDEKAFYFQGFGIKDVDRTGIMQSESSIGSGENGEGDIHEFSSHFIGIDEREVYEVDIEYPKIKVYEEGKIILPIGD